MNIKLWWLLPALLILPNCTTTYTHPTKNVNQFERERAACERTARKTLAAKGIT
ncbi:MAG: hypothetical protein ABFD12_10255 [Syntrophorhabdus sp.]